ncbi:hypothetical protein FS837_003375, partial [Tulasnella sp. UAMH 9824]
MMISLNDFYRVAEGFPGTASLYHVLSVFATCLAVQPLLRLHTLQNSARQVTAWLTSAQNEVNTAMGATDGFYDERQEALMPNNEERRRFEEGIPEILAVLPQTRTRLLEGLQVKPLLVTRRTTCVWCRNPGGLPGNRPLQRHRPDIDITLITAAYTKVQGRLSVGRCSTCKADYFPDRIVRKDDNTRELRQFYEDDTKYLRISKPAKLWVARSVAIAQAQMVLQHQTFSGYAAWFNKTYGPNGFTQAFNQVGMEWLAMTDEQSCRMFAKHMVRVLGQALAELAPETAGVFHSTFDPTTQELVTEANQWFITSQRGILPGALVHTCKDCTHTKRYRANVPLGQQRHAVAEQPDDAEGMALGNPENPDPVADLLHNLPNVQRPDTLVNGDGERVVRMAVMDGKEAGHAVSRILWHARISLIGLKLCNAPTPEPCRNPPLDFKQSRFCDEHAAYNQICGFAGCHDRVAEGSKVCGRQTHQEFYRKWSARFGRTSVYSVSRAKERRTLNNQTPALPQAPLPPMPTLPADDCQN